MENKKIKCCFVKKDEKIYIFTISKQSVSYILEKIYSETKLNKNFFIVRKVKSFPLNKRKKIDTNKLIKHELYK